jgi:hypothetical protein
MLNQLKELRKQERQQLGKKERICYIVRCAGTYDEERYFEFPVCKNVFNLIFKAIHIRKYSKIISVKVSGITYKIITVKKDQFLGFVLYEGFTHGVATHSISYCKEAGKSVEVSNNGLTAFLKRSYQVPDMKLQPRYRYVNQQLNGQLNLWKKRNQSFTQQMIAEFLDPLR